MILDVISFDTGTMSLTAYKERYVNEVESLLETRNHKWNHMRNCHIASLSEMR